MTGAGRLALEGRAHLSSTAWGRWESGLWLKVGAGVGFLSTAEGPAPEGPLVCGVTSSLQPHWVHADEQGQGDGVRKNRTCHA